MVYPSSPASRLDPVVDARLDHVREGRKKGDKPEMIDCEALKERVYWAMPTEQIAINILAGHLNMQRNKVAFFLRLLRLDGRVEYLGRRYDCSVHTLRSFWRRK